MEVGGCPGCRERDAHIAVLDARILAPTYQEYKENLLSLNNPIIVPQDYAMVQIFIMGGKRIRDDFRNAEVASAFPYIYHPPRLHESTSPANNRRVLAKANSIPVGRILHRHRAELG